jgi:hypothetical protein
MAEYKNFMAICILGMHRSGTSVTARAINLLGAYLGEEKDLMPYTTENPEGFWERLDIYDLQERILHTMKTTWDTMVPLSDMWHLSPEIQPYRNELVELIERNFINHQLWAWKDPRTSILLPLWKDVLDELGIKLSCIFVVRNPLDIAKSIKKRNSFSYSKSFGIWFNYTITALVGITDIQTVFVSYDRFLSKWEFELGRCANGFNIEWPPKDAELKEKMNSFIRPDLRHSFSSVDDLQNTPELVKELYSILLKIADGGATLSNFPRVLSEMYQDFTKYAWVLEPTIGEEHMREHDTKTEQRIDELQSQINELIANESAEGGVDGSL